MVTRAITHKKSMNSAYTRVLSIIYSVYVSLRRLSPYRAQCAAFGVRN